MNYKYVNADNSKLILLGYEAENIVTKVLFNVKDTIELYGDGGDFTLAVTNKNYPDGYPVPVSRNGDYIEWTVELAQLVVGLGTCQWTYSLGEQVKKSGKYSIKVTDSIGGSETPPASYTPWLEQAESYKTDAETAAQTCLEIENKLKGLTWGDLGGN